MACHTGSGENLQMNLLPQLLLSSTYLLSLKLYLIFGSWLISTRFLRRSPCHLSVTDIIIRLFTRRKLSLRLVRLFNQTNLHPRKVLILPFLLLKASTCGLNGLILERQIVLGFLHLNFLRRLILLTILVF